MATEEIDAYLAELEPVARATLEELRRRILAVVPEAEQGMSYGAPAFKVDGKTVAGFAAYAKHLSYLPHSGDVIARLGDELTGYATSKGALKFALDEPLPAELVARLIEVRRRELGGA